LHWWIRRQILSLCVRSMTNDKGVITSPVTVGGNVQSELSVILRKSYYVSSGVILKGVLWN